MAYTKTQWVDSNSPYINAENLNKIENGIYNVHATADDQLLTTTENTDLVDRLSITTSTYTSKLGKILDKIVTLVSGHTTSISTINTNITALQNKIHISTSEPTAAEGSNGDIWIVYEE